MKQGWTYKKLGEVCNIDYGTRVVRSRDAGSIYPVYGGGGATFKMDAYNREDCMVISRFGMSEQCTRFVKGKFFLNDSGLTLSMKEPCMIQAFMDWEVFSLNNIIYSLGRGAAQKNLDTKALADVILSYPNSLSEQQRIVSRLDSAFAHIDELKANAEKQVNEARALFQKALSKAMEPKEGWEEKTLKDLSSIIGDGIHGTPKYSNDGEYFFINGNNLENGRIVIKENTKRVNHEEYQKYYLDLNDSTVLLSINGTIGKTAFYNGEPLVLGKSACYINVLPSLLKEYLRYYLLSDIFFNYSQKNSRQATIVNLGLKEIRKMPISIPPLSEQQRIVERLDALSKNVKALEENQRKVMAECDALKQALLRKVFE